MAREARYPHEWIAVNHSTMPLRCGEQNVMSDRLVLSGGNASNDGHIRPVYYVSRRSLPALVFGVRLVYQVWILHRSALHSHSCDMRLCCLLIMWLTLCDRCDRRQHNLILSVVRLKLFENKGLQCKVIQDFHGRRRAKARDRPCGPNAEHRTDRVKVKGAYSSVDSK